MRLVPSALVRPHHCAVFPQLGANHADGFFDSGNDITAIDPHIYVSVVAVKEMAKQLGWSPPEETQVQENRLQVALERVKSLEMQLEQKQEVIDAVDVIESAAFTARKKRGPKPQLERTAA